LNSTRSISGKQGKIIRQPGIGNWSFEVEKSGSKVGYKKTSDFIFSVKKRVRGGLKSYIMADGKDVI
jgi:hypothetical protein